eukprot:TRINITY_DN110810_c0_g1_i1.p1 TRINITY_DN110810_c0_g1~~TRINITY_DN110810_c0_g1_i1.p1  ORF type:complete len:483 (+),score=30.42 TRINITY_DN110810_c0_g1_i1:90-1538(+)
MSKDELRAAGLTSFLMTTNVGRVCGLLVAGALLATLLRWVCHWIPPYIFLSSGCLIVAAYYLPLVFLGNMRRWTGTGEDLKRVYARMPTANRAPRPPFWAFGPNFQFGPWIMYHLLLAMVSPIPYVVVKLRVYGRIDKSKPADDTNTRTVEDDVYLSYYPPKASSSSDGSGLPANAPLILVEPGLTCTSQDVPGSSFLRLAISRGFRVVVVERRGHAAPLLAPRWNLFGDADDAEQIYRFVEKEFQDAPMFWIGISSGSKLIVHGLGLWDERRKNGDTSAPRFTAAACVAPGYDLTTCFLGFGFPYTKICLAGVRDIFLKRNEAALRAYDAKAYDRAVKSEDLQTLLTLVAPFAGYPSAQEYFAAENPVLFAPKVTTPCLIINAADDPLTIVENAFAKSPYHEGSPTFVDMLEKSPCGMLLITPSGSHCPFLDGFIFPFTFVSRALGGLIISSWGDRSVLEFFEGYLVEVQNGTAPATTKAG